MYVVDTSVQFWIEVAVSGAAIPLAIYFLGQNSDRKKEISAAFESVNKQVSIDRSSAVQKTDELNNKLVRLETIVEIKREAVDKVENNQNQANVRLAMVETNVAAIKESQARVETHWVTVSEKLESLVGIKEQIKGLTEDVREIKEAQAKSSE